MKDAEAVTFAGGRLDRATAPARRRSRRRALAADPARALPAALAGPAADRRPRPAAARPGCRWRAEVFADDPDPPVFLGVDAGAPALRPRRPRLAAGGAGRRRRAPSSTTAAPRIRGCPTPSPSATCAR